jgi:hypothetical protein
MKNEVGKPNGAAVDTEERNSLERGQPGLARAASHDGGEGAIDGLHAIRWHPAKRGKPTKRTKNAQHAWSPSFQFTFLKQGYMLNFRGRDQPISRWEPNQ